MMPDRREEELRRREEEEKRAREEEAAATVASLRFNPTGLQGLSDALNRSLSPTSIHASRLAAADIAFFVANAHHERSALPAGDFHPMFHEARELTGTGLVGRQVRAKFRDNIMNLAFDALTALDRVDGGCTVAVRVSGSQSPGTRTPGTVPLPQDLPFHVYAFPPILAEIPTAKAGLARMVQMFAEEIGVYAVQRFENMAKERLKWNFNKMNDEPAASRPPTQHFHRARAPLIPNSQGTTHFVFHGRPRGELDAMLADVREAPSSQQRQAELEEEIEVLRRQAEDYEVMIDGLDVDLANEKDKVTALTAQLAERVREQDTLVKAQSEALGRVQAEKATVLEAHEKVLKVVMKQKETIRQLKLQLTTNAAVQTSPGLSQSEPPPPPPTPARPSTPSGVRSVLYGAASAHTLRSKYARGFGIKVQQVVEKHQLDYLTHNVCEAVASSYAAIIWIPELQGRLAVSEAIAMDLKEAMEADLCIYD
ncbi:uncharacterized protein B0H18DRAFT_1116241 [Fomitopsis serialis]|uniref:uncharacterized protein n=1 Tax=Fomitopsis serialis TaxID=139415 RepID=UPI002007ED1B|nr:uncharacterized protein B0H18DRAFT_1116241 [Neoantrodia serialis]KAH9931427.1 hypothetical protein B0H18DRAFT_1116241 [Neoantrodia serialis]